MDILANLVAVACIFWLDPEGVCAEVITLCLQQVGGQVLGTVTVVEAESGAESGSGDTPESTLGDNASRKSVQNFGFMDWQVTHSLHPACALWIALLKKSSKSKFSRSGLARYLVILLRRTLDLRMFGNLRLSDVLQEDGPDNASTTPHERNFGLVQLPVVLLSGLIVVSESLHSF